MRRRRKTKQKPIAILTADWHIRADTPISRTDDFVSAMRKKVEFIFDLAATHNIPVLIAGDLGHRASWTNGMLSWFLETVKNKLGNTYLKRPIVIPGQHDLKNHRLDEIEQYGLGVLENGGGIHLHHADFETMDIVKVGYRSVGMIHTFIWSGESDDHWPGQDKGQGVDLLKKYPDFDLILSGDNHKSFVVEYDGRLLVNPGSIMRTTAKQVNHRPRVYFYYDSNTVEPVYLPIEKDVIDRSHIDSKIDRQNKLQAFVERATNQKELSLSFEDNLKQTMKSTRLNKKVVDYIWEAVG